ncbi:MAG: hypothetical protein JO249_03455 [Acidobacteria bacterium]|nr:hypothetical protein [Acidobacteriota bacterium]
MPSLLVCTQPAARNLTFFRSSGPSTLLQHLSAATHLTGITPASNLGIRPVPELTSTGIPQLDALIGGLPRGCLTEIYGMPSSGRTSILLSAMAAATCRQEACALVDVSNAFNPHSAAAAGMDLGQLLWVRCNETTKKNPADLPADFAQGRGTGRLQSRVTDKIQLKSDMARMAQALKVADLLVQSGGFGFIAIDLGDQHQSTSRRTPLASWFRFRRAVENTPTVLLVISQAPCARSCASLVLRLACQSSPVDSSSRTQRSILAFQLSRLAGDPGQQITVHNFLQKRIFVDRATPAHARLFEGISIRLQAERWQREPKLLCGDKTAFSTTTVWCR